MPFFGTCTIFIRAVPEILCRVNRPLLCMARGRTNFHTFNAFLSLLSQKITFLDFKKEWRYIIEFSSGLKTDNDGVQSDKPEAKNEKSPILRRRPLGRSAARIFICFEYELQTSRP